MKHFYLILVSALLSNFALAQGINKYGGRETDPTKFVDKNGAIGSPSLVNTNGQIIVATTLPSVTTTPISSIKGSTANTGGNVTSTGGATITDKGVCWSTSSSVAPNINDNTKLSQGAGTVGTYTSAVTGLLQNTVYYLRAYATNSKGTAYGETLTFTTISIAVGDRMQGGTVYALVKDVNDNVTGGFIVSADRGQKNRNDLNSTVSDANSGSGLEGFKDWFVPSTEQLQYICSIKGSIGMGNVKTVYWSSKATIAGSGSTRLGYHVQFDGCSELYSIIQNPQTSAYTLFNVKLIRDFTL